MTFGSGGEDRERKGSDRKELVKVLMDWRQETYNSGSINFLSGDIEDIITEDGISLVAKISPARLHRDGLALIVKELGETFEWGSRHAEGMFKQVWKHDHGDSDKVLTYN